MRVFAQNVKRPQCEADHLTPTNLEFEKKSADTSPAFMSSEQPTLTFKLYYIQSHWNRVHTFARRVL
jgi:hypothetical protein